MSFWGELKRRDVFKVAVAYLVSSWLIFQVVSALTDPLGLPDVLDTVVVVLLAIGFPFALVIAWVYEVTPEGIRVTANVDGDRPSAPGRRLSYVVFALFGLAVGLFAINRFLLTPASNGFGAGSRLAILPCTDVSPDPSNAFFAPGIHQELIRQLGSLKGLQVIGASSVQQYIGARTPAPQVARELQVQAVMECSALYSGNQARLTTFLLDGASASTLWSSVYLVDMSNLGEIFRIQADVATRVANALRVEFFDDERRRIERVPTESRKAYELYLEGLARGPFERLELMKEAVALDAGFAEAWSRVSLGLSLALIGQQESEARAAMSMDAAEAAQRAIELAPNEPLGYTARAVVGTDQRDWLGAERDFLVAREGVSSPVENSVFLLAVADFENARATLQQGLETSPRDLLALAYLPMVYELLGDSEAADAAYRRGNALLPEFGFGSIVWSLVRLGRGEVGPGYPDPISVAADGLSEVWTLTQDGDRNGALALLRRLASENSRPAQVLHLSAWAAYLGQPEFALQLLRSAVAGTGTGSMMQFAWLPVFHEMRQLDGFRDLLREIGLVDYWETRGWPDICRPLGNGDIVCS